MAVGQSTCSLCGSPVKREGNPRKHFISCSKACRRILWIRFSVKPLTDRFWAYVEKSNGCWLWTGPIQQSGHGFICVGPKGGARKINAHRLSWELHFGQIPPGLLVCHKCDNPPCVNPSHLFLGTHADNTKDMVDKGRHRPRRVLTVEAVIAIRASKVPDRELGEQYGVSPAAIRFVKSRRNWKWVP